MQFDYYSRKNKPAQSSPPDALGESSLPTRADFLISGKLLKNLISFSSREKLKDLVNKPEYPGGLTPLQRACRDGASEFTVKLLLAAGANPDTTVTVKINGREVQSVTALHLAAINRHYGLYKILLNAGANDSIRDTDDYTAAMHLFAHIPHDSLKIFNQLLALDLIPVTVEEKELFGNAVKQALIEALFSADRSVITNILKLIEDNPRIFDRDLRFYIFNHDNTPFSDNEHDSFLIPALIKSEHPLSTEIFKKLLSLGALFNRGYINESTQTEPTAIRLAVLSGADDLFKCFLEAGANPQASFLDGHSVASLAISKGQGGILRLVRAAGVTTRKLSYKEIAAIKQTPYLYHLADKENWQELRRVLAVIKFHQDQLDGRAINALLNAQDQHGANKGLLHILAEKPSLPRDIIRTVLTFEAADPVDGDNQLFMESPIFISARAKNLSALEPMLDNLKTPLKGYQAETLLRSLLLETAGNKKVDIRAFLKIAEHPALKLLNNDQKIDMLAFRFIEYLSSGNFWGAEFFLRQIIEHGYEGSEIKRIVSSASKEGLKPIHLLVAKKVDGEFAPRTNRRLLELMLMYSENPNLTAAQYPPNFPDSTGLPPTTINILAANENIPLLHIMFEELKPDSSTVTDALRLFLLNKTPQQHSHQDLQNHDTAVTIELFQEYGADIPSLKKHGKEIFSALIQAGDFAAIKYLDQNGLEFIKKDAAVTYEVGHGSTAKRVPASEFLELLTSEASYQVLQYDKKLRQELAALYTQRENPYHLYLYIKSLKEALGEKQESGGLYLLKLMPHLLFAYEEGSVSWLARKIEGHFDSNPHLHGQPYVYEPELLLLIHRGATGSRSEATIDPLTASLTGITRFMNQQIKVDGHRINNWGDIGALTFSFQFWRFDSERIIGQSASGDLVVEPSLLEKFGLDPSPPRETDYLPDSSNPFPAKDDHYLGNGFIHYPNSDKVSFPVKNPDGSFRIESLDPETFIELRRAYILVSNPAHGTLLIRNSSRVFGRDRFNHPAYWCPPDEGNFSVKELLNLTPDFIDSYHRSRSREFFSIIDPVINREPDFDYHIGFLLREVKGLKQAYSSWKFDSHIATAWQKDKESNLLELKGGHYSPGFPELVNFLTERYRQVSYGALRPGALPALAGVRPDYPPWSPYPFHEKDGTLARYFVLNTERLWALKLLAEDSQSENTGRELNDTGLINFLQQAVLDPQAELVMLTAPEV
ncbi:MAG: ankyrin repeat domain-containing protein [Candidatus Dadabacteria bacterium]|nr:MAG: ankyrin repeat domain-containing protein [Candidatus Dadabacteria bacterium]